MVNAQEIHAYLNSDGSYRIIVDGFTQSTPHYEKGDWSTNEDRSTIEISRAILSVYALHPYEAASDYTSLTIYPPDKY